MRLGFFLPMDWYAEEGSTPAVKFHEITEQVCLIDRLGFDSCWIAENHFSTESGICCAPPVFLADLFSRTKQVSIGPAVSVAPLHHPVALAEEYAMLEMLSGGRLLLGLGTGYSGSGFAGFGVAASEKRDRLAEALEVIEKAWTGELIAHEGRFHSFPPIHLPVAPKTLGRGKLWLSLTDRERMLWAARNGYGMLLSPFISMMTFDTLRDLVGAIAAAYAGASLRRSAEDIGVVVHVFVGRDAAKAQQFASHFLKRRLTALAAREEGIVGPNGGTADTGRRDRNVDMMLRRARGAGFLAFGDADTVASHLHRLAACGVRYVIAHTEFGGMPHDAICESIERLHADVLPRIERAEISI